MAQFERNELKAFDLQDFNNWNLNSAGELELHPLIRHPIHIEAGDNILEFDRVSVTVESESQNETLFTLRNMASPDGERLVIMDTVREMIPVVIAGVEHRAPIAKQVIIGTDTTPELQLNDTADPQHFQIRIGGLAGRLHFSDLYSRAGTTVLIHPEDVRGISSPRRMGMTVDGEFVSDEAARQKWSRGI